MEGHRTDGRPPGGATIEAGSRIKVVWLTTAYPWQGDPVAGIFHRTSARSLAQAGVAVTVISPTPYSPWPLPILRERWRRYAEAPIEEVDQGVRVIRPRYVAIPGDPPWGHSDRSMQVAVGRVLEGLPEPDVFHAHYPAPMGMTAWRLTRHHRRPYVVTAHGSDQTWRSTHRSRLAAYRRALRDAARVLAVSRSLAAEMRDVAEVEADVLPIGVNVERFTTGLPDRDSARRALALPNDRVVIVLIATLLRAKGIRPFVDSLADLGPPYFGVIVGDGPEAGYRAQDAQDVVAYHGMQPNEVIPRYLAAADMLILPSDTEGLPTVIVEAGAAGVPVVATPVGGIPELLGEDRGLLIREPSAAAISEGLRAVASDPAAARARAERLHRFVLEQYDALANGRRLAAVYRSVLAGTTRTDSAAAGE